MPADWIVTWVLVAVAVVTMRLGGWFLIGRDPPYLLRRILELLPGSLLAALVALAVVRHGWIGLTAAVAAAVVTRQARHELAGLLVGGGSFFLLSWIAS